MVGRSVRLLTCQTKYRSLLGDNECGSFGHEGWLSEEACKKMFALSGLNFDETIAAAKKPGFKSFTMKAKSKVILNVKMTVGESHNVAAVLPGTDLKDEYLVFTAHWDHFGIGTPIDGDSIYNGASIMLRAWQP